MLKHMENWSPVQSNSQTPSSKREERERASTCKNRSRLGKEPMGAEEAPESWYEPIRRPNFEEEVPWLRQSNVPKTQGTFRNEPHNDPLFEPTFGGQEREPKSKNGFYMHDEYNSAHNYRYPEEGIGVKSFKQAPEVPRQTDIPRAKRSYFNPLFEPSNGWEEEPQRTQYRNEERYAPHQKPDRYFQPQRGPGDGSYTGYPKEQNLREPYWDQPHNPEEPLRRDPLLRDQVIGLIQKVCGPLSQGVQTLVYKKPYPEWIDRQFEVPRGFKIPDFTLFYGDGIPSTLEHIARFIAQCKELANNDFQKLKLFPNSLT
ncbi:hypothetical protein RHGRI_015030 [Rhododendron griersonianum]|uniref:Uncharacterized protein n=1 Tax=Rhododendron griersonianum TaxID=479676 RepID=A0AAV6KC39_9ERIC|nr:hypothetical protein RHGRI_015030 [Rhododendron griersonianum]